MHITIMPDLNPVMNPMELQDALVFGFSLIYRIVESEMKNYSWSFEQQILNFALEGRRLDQVCT